MRTNGNILLRPLKESRQPNLCSRYVRREGCRSTWSNSNLRASVEPRSPYAPVEPEQTSEPAALSICGADGLRERAFGLGRDVEVDDADAAIGVEELVDAVDEGIVRGHHAECVRHGAEAADQRKSGD